MFSLAAFSDVAFSDAEFPALEADAFQPFLEDIDAERVWLLELETFSLAAGSGDSGAFSDGAFSSHAFSGGDAEIAGGTVTLYFASEGYASRPTDTPASQYYDGRLTDEIRVERWIAGRTGVGGLARTEASAKLLNGDGGLDTLLRDYAVDGRRATLWIGRKGDPRANFGQVFGGIVEHASVDEQSMTIKFSDGLAKIARPIQETVYAGSGGTEGGDDLKGKPKPQCWGEVFNITPVLVDATNLIYQVHDGAISDVPRLWDRQIALTKVPGAPAAGEYQVTAAAGTVKLGAAPAGTITCDVEGDASGTGYIDRTADIVLRILTTKANLTSLEIDPSSFGGLNTVAGAAVGIWIGAEVRTVASVVEDLLNGVAAWGGFDRRGYFSVGLVDVAEGPSAAEYSEEQILAIARDPLPSEVDPIVWRTRVGWQKNYTVTSDLAAAVTAARRAFAQSPMRESVAEDAGVKSRHLLARELLDDAATYANEADADTEVIRRLALWGNRREPFRVALPALAMQRDIGDVIGITHSRLGLAAGRAVRVLGVGITAAGNQTELMVLA